MQDVDSLSQSFSRATPRESPSASPMRELDRIKQASVDSLRFGAQMPKLGSRRVLPQPSHINVVRGANFKKGSHRPWAPSSTIWEEEEGIHGESKKKLSRCCLVWIAIFFTMVAFFAGALLFWVVTMPKAPHIIVQNVAFSYFGLDDGVDNSGVPTMVASLNSTATLQLFNPSRFFGYHIEASSLGLKYLDLSIAEGQLTAFYLQRRTVKKVTVTITADKQFLHGAGPSFDRRYNSAPSGVTLKLEGVVLTRAYVMGQMLKNMFSNAVACTFNFVAGPGPTEWKVQQLICPSAYIRPSDD